MHHPGMPNEVVHSKGKYAIRADGQVVRNNPTINGMTDVKFTDSIPEWAQSDAEKAKVREGREAAASIAAAERAKARDASVAAEVQRGIEAYIAAQAAAVPTKEESEGHTAFMIGTADERSLRKWVKMTYGVDLPRNKTLDELRIEAENLSL
jgi:hypothetical protein